MKRVSTIRYRVKDTGKVVSIQTWVQNIEKEDTQRTMGREFVVLRLLRDDNGELVSSVSRDGVKTVLASSPEFGGAYAYIPVAALKVLADTGNVKRNDRGEWVRLILDPMSPTLEDFDKMEPVSKL